MSTDNLDKSYEPQNVESRWYSYWMENDLFHADAADPAAHYSIVIPPPNVTGNLHMGHALNNTLQDIMIRFHRMKGYNTLWLPGMDHAGIATQNVVERALAAEGKTREELGREKFVERVWAWKEQYGGNIINQLKRLGCSCDWKRERFTMDEGLSRAVREVFVRLYEQDLIYRGDRIINWCPRCLTALADLEVEHEEIDSHLYYIRYLLADGVAHLTVATTRPETLLGDTAVAVHPEDDRFKSFIGHEVLLPVLGRRIPVIADEYVDREFGTGSLKITPAHDPNDFEIGRRHGLAAIKCIDDDGRMNGDAGPYQGQDRFECRKNILEDLKKDGLLEKIDDYRHSVGHCYRCKTVIEPNLSKQWFVKIQPLADKAIKAVETGRTRIIPKNWEKTYFEWMYNIKDWCISRQLWWGHRIPAYFCLDCGEMMVAREAPQTCPKCGGSKIEQETDVLDTWFSSALWPFSTLGWPDQTADLKKYYPTSCLVTGFDILFFWVARMMMMGIWFRDEIPFKDVYIHALVRDADGQKMSKSKGNVIDPLEVMDQFGTDAFRFTLTALAAQGRDVRLSNDRIEGYRHFVNKLWNAARFTLMNLEGFEPTAAAPELDENASLADRWIMSRIAALAGQVDRHIVEYHFDRAAGDLYQFVWHEFCDWYLEMAKNVLYGENEAAKRKTREVLAHTLGAILKMLHPIMPFVTEEIWQKMPGAQGSVMIAPFPTPADGKSDPTAEQRMTILQSVVTAVRNIRGEMNVPPSHPVEMIMMAESAEVRTALENLEGYILNLARGKSLKVTPPAEKPKGAAAGVAGEVEVLVLMKGLIDLDEEARRIEKELAKLDKEIVVGNRKLNNEDFLGKAPADVVAKAKDKVAALMDKKEKLARNLARVDELRG